MISKNEIHMKTYSPFPTPPPAPHFPDEENSEEINVTNILQLKLCLFVGNEEKVLEVSGA